MQGCRGAFGRKRSPRLDGSGSFIYLKQKTPSFLEKIGVFASYLKYIVIFTKIFNFFTVFSQFFRVLFALKSSDFWIEKN